MPLPAPTLQERAARLLDLVTYIHHPSHPFFACQTCKVAVPLSAISGHFSKLKIHNFRQRDVQLLLDAWKQLYLSTQPVALTVADDLKSWPYPVSSPYPPPLPILPVLYGLQCTYRDPTTGSRCPVIQQARTGMAKHCYQEHGWMNPTPRGRPFLKKTPAVHNQMWEAEVPCQRLRAAGIGGKAFRVSVNKHTALAASQVSMRTRKDRTWGELEAELDALQTKSSAQTQLGLGASTQYPIHMSPWLEKTGWPAYLEGQDLEAVGLLLAPPSHSEPGLRVLLQAFDSLIDQARKSILAGEVNVFALHRVNSFVSTRSFKKPFHSKILESTYARYKVYWHRLLSYVYRLTITQCGPDLHYVLTAAQQEALHQISAVYPVTSQQQLAMQPLARPPTPVNTVLLDCSFSPPSDLPSLARPDKPDDSIGVALDSASSLPPLSPLRQQQRQRQRRQSSCYQSPAEGAPSSPESHSSSRFNLSRQQSPAFSIDSSSSAEQEEPYSELAAAVEEAMQSSPPRTAARRRALASTPASAAQEQACLQLCISLLDHKLHGRVEDSIFVGFLAANGINRERTGFHEAVAATTALSGLVKLAQLLVIQHALCEHRAGRATHPADQIAELQDRFMTFGSSTPMNLVLNLRAYGKVIRNNTTAAGFIEWSDDGQSIDYRGVQLTINNLKWFMQDQTRTAFQQMSELLLLPDCEDDTWARHIPKPELSCLRDDPNRSKAGESFLDDPANKDHPVCKHPKFLLRRIKDNVYLQRRFLTDNEWIIWNPKAVRSYLYLTHSFLRRMLLLIYMTGGQPARATELLLLRWRNSPYGDIRNMFIENGQVMFVTSYHKNYSQSSTLQIIQRYLPREIGELLVWYLWLVVPFLHALHLLAKQQGDFTSPSYPGTYLWPASLLKALQGKGSKSAIEVAHTEAAGGKQPLAREHQEKHWDAAQLGQVIKDILASELSPGMQVLTWRHLAIAMSIRHLPEGSRFKRDYSLHEGNAAMDLQAAHTSNRASCSYARDKTAGPWSTNMLTHEFRTISRNWHAFLGFGGVPLPPRSESKIWLRGRAVPAAPLQKRAVDDDAAELNNFLRGNVMLRTKKQRVAE
jgi:hypothetical protein